MSGRQYRYEVELDLASICQIIFSLQQLFPWSNAVLSVVRCIDSLCRRIHVLFRQTFWDELKRVFWLTLPRMLKPSSKRRPKEPGRPLFFSVSFADMRVFSQTSKTSFKKSLWTGHHRAVKKGGQAASKSRTGKDAVSISIWLTCRRALTQPRCIVSSLQISTNELFSLQLEAATLWTFSKDSETDLLWRRILLR